MVIEASDLVGTWRRFGAAGPVYEVIGPGADATPDLETVRIRLLHTGEELDYGLRDLLDDPREA